MIKVLIIEDEIPARKKLKRFLDQLEAPVEVVAEMDTVEGSIGFLENETVDLIFSDIELLDGNAFEIYNQVSVNCPIIFTTAYDQFWMDAFESNGIEYLLKPFSKERFQKAWNKFLVLRKSASADHDILANIRHLIESRLTEKSYRKRFTVNSPRGISFLEVDDIAFFEANEGVIFAIDTSGKKHLINETTLKEIESQLHPSDFFRINRSELVSKKHLQKIERYTKNSLAIKMKGQENSLKTSQSNTASFREWIEK
ncbi:MAG: DNA-binding response regulator [Bacteroidetes bacterium]|nr:MAG: DNA-binding response regulator [Bacteroidota bacterium]